MPFAALAARRGDDRRLGWLLLLVAMAVYLAATLHQMRVLSYAEAALVIPWAGAVVASGRAIMTQLARPWRAPAAALAGLALLLAPAVAGGLVLDRAAGGTSAALRDRCDWPALHAWLRQSPEAPEGAVATYVFPGPWLSWATGRGVVSAPYHRNAAGILDVERLFLADDGEARAIAQRRGLGLIVLCQQSPGRGGHAWYVEASAPDGLYARLARGDVPGWLVRLDGGAPGLADFMVFGIALP